MNCGRIQDRVETGSLQKGKVKTIYAAAMNFIDP